MPQSVAIIIPCHNETENVPLIYQALIKTFRESLPQLQPQIWYVNDGSTDDTLDQIKQLQAKDDQVHYIDLSRSFGKKQRCMPAFQPRKPTTMPLWMPTYRIRHQCCRICMQFYKKATTWLELSAWIGLARLICVPSFRICSTNSSIRCPKRKSFPARAIFA